MQVLVTGGLGFIGSNFCRHILTKHADYSVLNVDKIGIGANVANLKDIQNEERYEFIPGDIRDAALMNEVVQNVDVIVNIAAETHVDRSIANPDLFIQNNIMGSFTVLEALRKQNATARFVQVSTDETYGEIGDGAFREDDRLCPTSPYAASKAATDMLVSAYHKTYQLDTIIARCTNNYGPHQFPEKFIPKTIIRAHLGLSVPLYGKGANIRDWIYVNDFCEALDRLVQGGRSGEIYNISADNELENLYVVESILNIMKKPKDLIMFVEDRPGHDFRYKSASSKIRAELDWRPQYRFQEALEITVNWYLNNDWWWKPSATDQILHPTPWKLRW